jgi:hypothetical protein
VGGVEPYCQGPYSRIILIDLVYYVRATKILAIHSLLLTPVLRRKVEGKSRAEQERMDVATIRMQTVYVHKLDRLGHVADREGKAPGRHV